MRFSLRSLFPSVILAGATAVADEAPPPWAYGFTVPPPPGTVQTAPGRAGPPPSDPTRYGLPATQRTFTRAEITDIFGPADFYPDEHPTPPAIVAHGKAPTVWACARCHYANGQGRPENAPLAGLPADYFVAQMHAFRDGTRTSSDPRKPNTPMMVEFAKAMTEDEVRAAADYYSSLPARPWIRVVEAETVPQTTVSAGMFLQVTNGGVEPIGDRILEVPENPDAVEIQRDPHTGFIAYVPPGSVSRGRQLVTNGGAQTVACNTCHGAQLEGRSCRTRARPQCWPAVRQATSFASFSI